MYPHGLTQQFQLRILTKEFFYLCAVAGFFLRDSVTCLSWLALEKNKKDMQ